MVLPTAARVDANDTGATCTDTRAVSASANGVSLTANPSRPHAAAALDAVRAALTSDDPEVVRAMAERVGLEVDTDRAIPLPCGHFAGARIKRIRVSGPWREVPDAD